jgi:glycosyltransferase involved in cell wall biosynthesis
MPKKLLIVEEALRDLKAHWFEYIKTIDGCAENLGWDVEVACHEDAAPEIIKAFNSLPIFEYARYLDHDKKKLPGEKHYGFILHSIRIQKSLARLFKNNKKYDDVFVPTVLIHHLLAWYYIMKFNPNRPKHVTLFFVTNPGVWDAETKKSFFPKSSIILRYLLRLFSSLVKSGKVTFAVETKGAKTEFESLCALPFKLLPHPVPFNQTSQIDADKSNSYLNENLSFACYGFARHEKGSDLLRSAIEQILKDKPEFKGHFTIQWTDSFKMPDGTDCGPGEILTNHPKVTIINRAVMSDEYNQLLAQTDCMILPYRNSSYYARVSRVAIEAAANAIPIIYTKNGWLEETAVDYGAGIGIEDESVTDIIGAIYSMQINYASYRLNAQQAVQRAHDYYSPNHFVHLLLE